MNLLRYADRPDLRERRDLSERVFPAFMSHNAMSPRYWARLYTDFPRFQQVLVDGDDIVAEAFALPIPWDGTAAGLPAGWDAAFELGMETGLEPTALYPLIPIERYLSWRRPDGSHFDPWLRLHERVGGRIVAAAPDSMTIEAPRSAWEEWTGMELPEDGEYIVPGMLDPLRVRDGRGRHVEPNVWVVHGL